MREIKFTPNQKYRKSIKGVLTNLYCKMKERKEVNFSLDDFHEMFLNDIKYIRLYQDWVKSNYFKMLKPSIDRINPKKPYLIDNIHMVTWKENRYKQRLDLRFIRARKVYQLKDGEIVKIYPSQRLAVKDTGFSQGDLSMCLNGQRNKVGGFQWKYQDEVIGNIHEGEKE